MSNRLQALVWLLVMGYLTVQSAWAGANSHELAYWAFAFLFALLGLSGAYYIVVHSAE